MAKTSFPPRRRRIRKKGGIGAHIEKWIQWLEEPFEQLIHLKMLVPQAKASERLLVAERREVAALRAQRQS